jgi:hypothetical protein
MTILIGGIGAVGRRERADAMGTTFSHLNRQVRTHGIQAIQTGSRVLIVNKIIANRMNELEQGETSWCFLSPAEYELTLRRAHEMLMPLAKSDGDGKYTSAYRLNSEDISREDVLAWLVALPLAQQETVCVLWPSYSCGVAMTFGNFARNYDVLWYPGADDIYVVAEAEGCILEVTHEEQWRFTKGPANR